MNSCNRVLRAHPCVISAQARPSTANIGSVAQGIGHRPWSWIFAGLSEKVTPAPLGSCPTNVVAASAVGLVAGRHKALEVGDEDILIYLDDDVRLPEGWFERMLEPFGDPDVHFVGCRYLPDYECDPPSWMEGLWWEHDDVRTLGHLSLLEGGQAGRFYRPLLVWGLCFAVRRETVIKLCGFHPDAYPWELRRFRGDGENGLALKAELLGLKAYYQGKTHVFHRVPSARMTPEYFERRSFLQGISDSYTQIRRDRLVPPARLRSWKEPLRPIKWRFKREMIMRNLTTKGVCYLMNCAHMAGVQFHRNEVRNDPTLLEWVLKPDYFDYRLPEGWQKYLNQPRPA